MARARWSIAAFEPLPKWNASSTSCCPRSSREWLWANAKPSPRHEHDDDEIHLAGGSFPAKRLPAFGLRLPCPRCEGSGRGRLLVEIEHCPPAGQPSSGLPGKDPKIPTARTQAGSFPLVNHLKSKACHSQIGDRINLVIEFVVRDDPGGLAEIHEPGDERVAACGSTRETRKHHGNLRMDQRPHVLGATLEPGLIDRAEGLGHSFGICWHDSWSPF